MEFALYIFEAAKFRGNKTKLVSPLDEAPSVAVTSSRRTDRHPKLKMIVDKLFAFHFNPLLLS